MFLPQKMDVTFLKTILLFPNPQPDHPGQKSKRPVHDPEGPMAAAFPRTKPASRREICMIFSFSADLSCYFLMLILVKPHSYPSISASADGISIHNLAHIHGVEVSVCHRIGSVYILRIRFYRISSGILLRSCLCECRTLHVVVIGCDF